MAHPSLVPSLKAFSSELTQVAPRRTLPDWDIGDPAHQLRPSGHNLDDTPGSKSEDTDADDIPDLRAVDYRLPLNASFTAEQLIQFIIKECRAGRVTWIKYIIFNRRIWSASDSFRTRQYHGSNPHSTHFHISSKPDTKSERTTKKIGLVKLLGGTDMPLTSDDLSKIREVCAKAQYDVLHVAATGQDYLNLKFEGQGSIGAAVKANLQTIVVKPIVEVLLPAVLGVDEEVIARLTEMETSTLVDILTKGLSNDKLVMLTEELNRRLGQVDG